MPFLRVLGAEQVEFEKRGRRKAGMRKAERRKEEGGGRGEWSGKAERVSNGQFLIA